MDDAGATGYKRAGFRPLTPESSIMYDLKWIRDNPEAFDRGLTRRGLAPGAAEVLASPVTAGPDQAASLDRTMRLLGQAAGAVN